MASHTLNALPMELIVFIVENLDNVADIAALAQTNRRLYSTAHPLLYKRAAQCGDARPLAWAARHGLMSTLKMALDAGIDPNHEFVERISADDWERACVVAQENVVKNRGGELWDPVTRKPCESIPPTLPRTGGAAEIDEIAKPIRTSETAQLPATPSVTSQPSFTPFSRSFTFRPSLAPQPVKSTSSPNLVTRRYRALHVAASRGYNDILLKLLDAGASTNVPSERFCSCAPAYGLLNALENPEDDRDPPSWSPLHIAICHSHEETAQLLLEHGASHMMEHFNMTNANDPDNLGYGSTALHHAAGMGLTKLVDYLVTSKIQTNIDPRDDRTLTPFYHAYAQRRWDTTIPQLLSLGASVEVEIKMYIPYSAITPFGEACRLGHFAVADQLLKLGANPKHGFVTTTVKGGCLTPLHMCCMQSAVPVGTAPPTAAAEEGVGEREGEEDEEREMARMRIIEKLISLGADINARDCFGNTPLMAAMQWKNRAAIKALIKAGADLKDCATEGREALIQEIKASLKNSVATASSGP
ncbi:uncharacterized protein CTHT_0031960 [Thermochaetoides thermophila DSM 1495]|uniref:Uncharacterized protein n=1 Tax=Chaetomium thermophilum (strain DSM 1495 / CBS 144.50 / IMI 039719) TaxID=759272 RepID=G0S4X0_CHATD|nr:hypothetical protein CTHT_0031960 [Thermochaetoides thermophila DSM 1495]EGS21341.1 hypothetical protein CTHT_0031960 [Thermochaetoides thermophila DSM 1495]